MFLVVSLAACGSSPSPSPSHDASPSVEASEPAAATPDPAAAEAAIARVLDPGSRDLLALIAPEETIEATIDLADPKRAASAAMAQGLDGQVVSIGTVLVVGPRDDVVGFAAGAQATRIAIAEDHRPDRWLPAEAPSIRIPAPGWPYRLGPMPVDRPGLLMEDDQANVLLAELARKIETIDGRPYVRFTVTGECDPSKPPSCLLRASGVSVGVGDRSDGYLVVSNKTTAGNPHLDSSTHESVPRDLRRAAEWIARHDPKALAEISSETGCCDARWDPGRPGVVTVTWTRPCSAAVARPEAILADTGNCFDTLAIAVDLGRGTVVSIERAAGP
ncbi:MAG TPA: hypothetical protein VHM48_12335 [Candidatus Limnocylindrales bacterium]|nr:hypothetical protein [Candidatus Limnocylindrales bacterium]